MSPTKFTIGLLLALAFSSCGHRQPLPTDPKGVITRYITKSFNVTSPNDRAELAAYLAGDAKQRLSAWSEDQFREAFMDDKRQFLKLLFTETKPGPTENQMDVTYELTYLDRGGKDGRPDEAKVTQKKFAQLVRVDGRWLISDVQSIKELVEYTHAMSLP